MCCLHPCQILNFWMDKGKYRGQMCSFHCSQIFSNFSYVVMYYLAWKKTKVTPTHKKPELNLPIYVEWKYPRQENQGLLLASTSNPFTYCPPKMGSGNTKRKWPLHYNTIQAAPTIGVQINVMHSLVTTSIPSRPNSLVSLWANPSIMTIPCISALGMLTIQPSQS